MPTEWGRYSRVCAITDALRADAPVTHWVMTENPDPQKQKAYGDLLRRKKPLCWGLKLASLPKRWGTFFPGVEVELEDMDEIVSRLPYTSKVETPPSRRKKYQWSRTPIFYALGRNIADGFTEIDVFGADFRGTHNVDPGTGKLLGVVAHSPEARWRTERAHFRDIRREAAAHGVRIRHVLPSVDDDLCGSLDDEGDLIGSLEGTSGGDQQGHHDPQAGPG